MSRLSARDKRRAAEVAAALREKRAPHEDVSESVFPLLADLLAAPLVGGYRLAPTDDGLARIQDARSWGFPSSGDALHDVFGSYFERLGARRGVYDPLCPPPRQRNRAVRIPWSQWCGGEGSDEVARELGPWARQVGLKGAKVGEAARTIWTCELGFRKLDIRAHDQLRVLVCDGDSLIYWLGAFQAEPFTERQRLLLKDVATPLRERLLVERRTDGAASSGARALSEAIEYIPSAAFVLDVAGRLAYANAVGRYRMSREARALRALFTRAALGCPVPPGACVTRIHEGSAAPRVLLILAGTGDKTRLGVERARERWSLTLREAEVLAHLAAGRKTSDIAARVRASARTIDTHVAALLRKAHADTRNQLVIDVWRLAEA